MIRIVATATRPPGMCLVSRDTEGPFFDTGLYARHRDPYMYIGTRWVEEAAKQLNMASQDEIEVLREQLASYAEKVENLERFVEAHTALEEAMSAVAEEPNEVAA